MNVHWWSCVLGFLCMPAEVILYNWTVSQSPSSISFMRVNSSAEITCSTSLSNPEGLNLCRRFHGDRSIVYLSLQNGQVIRTTPAAEFKGRIHVTPDQQVKEGHGFTVRLSLLELSDTDFYYCTWTRFISQTGKLESQQSKGTVIIITEEDPQHLCRDQIQNLALICVCAAVFTAIMLLIIGALILRCKRFKKHFRCTRAEKPSRPRSPPHLCPLHRTQYSLYMVTSMDTMDFRRIL